MTDPDETALTCLGKGNNTIVHLLKDGKTAVKSLNLEQLSTTLVDCVRNEIKLMRQMRDPHLIEYYTTTLDGNMLNIYFEYAHYGSVRKLMDYQNPNQLHCNEFIATVIQGTLEALVYLHKHSVIHRDVKADNILINKDGWVKLSDFGVAVEDINAVYGRRQGRVTFVGTIAWMAPEIVDRDNQNGYHEKVDMWSLGITLYELCFVRPPLFRFHPMKSVMLLLKNPAPIPTKSELRTVGLSDKFLKIFKLLLVKEPTQRIRAVDLFKKKLIKRVWKPKQLATRVEKLGIDATDTYQYQRRKMAEKLRQLEDPAKDNGDEIRDDKINEWDELSSDESESENITTAC